MVYPIYKNVFKIGTAGRASTAEQMKTIADMENFSPTIDGNIEEWRPFDQQGWLRRMATGKSLSIALNGKRNSGDPGNDYIAGCSMGLAEEVESKCEWVWPDGTTVTFDCVINVTNNSGGDSTAVAPLEFTLLSDGKPTITPPANT